MNNKGIGVIEILLIIAIVATMILWLIKIGG